MPHGLSYGQGSAGPWHFHTLSCPSEFFINKIILRRQVRALEKSLVAPGPPRLKLAQPKGRNGQSSIVYLLKKWSFTTRRHIGQQIFILITNPTTSFPLLGWDVWRCWTTCRFFSSWIPWQLGVTNNFTRRWPTYILSRHTSGNKIFVPIIISWATWRSEFIFGLRLSFPPPGLWRCLVKYQFFYWLGYEMKKNRAIK